MPLVGAAVHLLVPLGEDLKEWRKTKKHMPVLLSTDIAEKHLLYKHPGIQEAISMHQAQLQLRKAFSTPLVSAPCSILLLELWF